MLPLEMVFVSAAVSSGWSSCVSSPYSSASSVGQEQLFGNLATRPRVLQVVGQAAGPLVAGVAHDLTGDYQVAMLIFAALGAVAGLCWVGVATAASFLESKRVLLESKRKCGRLFWPLGWFSW